MRISIWRQFSSNHSSSFTVVGHFDTVEKAEQAETKLKALLEQIREFRSYDPNGEVDRFPTWPEEEASQQYGIEWDESFDWVVKNIDEHVVRFQQYVFVTTALAYTYQFSYTLEALMSKLAEETNVHGNSSEEMIILTELECIAPDARIASEIVAELRLYLDTTAREYMIPAWEIYSPKVDFSAYPMIKRPYGLSWEPNSEVIRAAINGLYQYQKAMIESQNIAIAEKDAIAALLPLKDEGFTFSVELNSDALQKIIRRIGSLSQTGAMGGQVENKGQLVRFPEIVFHRLQDAIPAIIGYIESQGCSDIHFSLKSVPYASKPEYLY
jgi:hypothetical protein